MRIGNRSEWVAYELQRSIKKAQDYFFKVQLVLYVLRKPHQLIPFSGKSNLVRLSLKNLSMLQDIPIYPDVSDSIFYCSPCFITKNMMSHTKK
jgi:hypothetical protein